MTEPSLQVWPAVGVTDAVVLMLHGGRANSTEPTSARQLAYRRMVPIVRSVHRAVGESGTAVWLLRNRVRGWNEPAGDALLDTHWALDRARSQYPQALVVLVGHSMGGRAASLCAGTDGVLAVYALAPWLEPDDPVTQLAGRRVLIAHGDRDRWTSPARSYEYAVRSRSVTPSVCRFELRGAGHPMLRHATAWTGLVRAFVAGVVGPAPSHPAIQAALAAPTPDGLRRPLISL
ncbi:MAG TPA: alpha/beta hydrolase [Pseudonocardiaceae bacterium]|nr:alpha/beta hydrolase [Pseudonocardiaceae bacterium]